MVVMPKKKELKDIDKFVDEHREYIMFCAKAH